MIFIEMVAAFLEKGGRVVVAAILAAPFLLSLDDLWIVLFFFVLLFGRARLRRPEVVPAAAFTRRFHGK